MRLSPAQKDGLLLVALGRSDDIQPVTFRSLVSRGLVAAGRQVELTPAGEALCAPHPLRNVPANTPAGGDPVAASIVRKLYGDDAPRCDHCESPLPEGVFEYGDCDCDGATAAKLREVLTRISSASASDFDKGQRSNVAQWAREALA